MQTLPLEIVGSSVFGRYPKISSAITYNMIVSDNFLVPFAGYKKILTFGREGRGIYCSERYKKLIVVTDNEVFAVTKLATNTYSSVKIGQLSSTTGDISIAENNANQIAICDKQNIYIYNYSTSVFEKVTTDFVPTYVDFQNGHFIAAVLNQPVWRLSDLNNGTSWPADSFSVGEFETKANNVQACIPIPGRSNLLFILGNTVTESWTNTGAQLFPYQKNTGINIDYGCVNSATIAKGDKFIIWVGINEKSGPVIMYSSGGDINTIEVDGINFQLERLTSPTDAYGFLFKQDGHLFYQCTFVKDNITFVYDFQTNKVFNLCDKYMNAHIAKQIAYFDNTYFFVSFENGDLYQIDSQYTTYDGDEIPRIRITNPFRLPDTKPFVVNEFEFLMEQGNDENPILGRADISISKDGGESFSNPKPHELNKLGKRRNIFRERQLGRANDLSLQFRFWGQGRFVLSDGTITISKCR